MNYIVKNRKEDTEKSTKEILIEIATETIAGERKKALNKIAEKLDVPGFRKGHIPEKVVVEKVGEGEILEEAVNSWLNVNFGEILKAEAPESVTFPKIKVLKIVPQNPVEISILFTFKPKIKLPDYKKIAQKANGDKKPPSEINEKEIDSAIQRLREYVARAINQNQTGEIKEENLPPLNDEFAKTVGGGKDLAELRERIKKDLEGEQKAKTTERNRLSLIEAILKETELNIPDSFLEIEIEKIERELAENLKEAGMNFEEYVKKSGKNVGDIKKDWQPIAEKRAKTHLIIEEIKTIEKIETDKEKVEKEVEHLLHHHKDADKERVKSYVEKMLSNEKLFEFLESQ